MKVLVTGGAGFIGSHLVRRLLTEGHEVRVLDNFATGRRGNLVEIWDHVELVEGDVRSYERVHTAVKGCEVVLHQAALPSVPRSVQDPLTSSEVNVTGTLNLLLSARDCDVRRVVSASSSSVYGANPALPKSEEMATMPLSPYAVSKLAAENYAVSFHAVYGVETVSLRYFNVFGPGQDPRSQYAAVIPNFITSLLASRPLVVFGDGEQSRDFTYIENVVDANLAAMKAPGIGGQVLNIARGERISLNQTIELLNNIAGVSAQVEYKEPRAGEVRHSLADVSKACELIGFAPTIDMEEGLRRTMDHFANLDDLAAPSGIA